MQFGLYLERSISNQIKLKGEHRQPHKIEKGASKATDGTYIQIHDESHDRSCDGDTDKTMGIYSVLSYFNLT